MTQQLTRADAVRTARITRGAVVVLAAGAVALGVVGLPEREVPTPGIPTAGPGTPGAEPSPAPGAPAESRFDAAEAAAVAARLAVLDNAPKIQRPEGIIVAEEPLPGVTEPAEDPGATAIADRVRYLGMVQSGRNRAALLRVDGRQRIVREGAVLGPPPENPSLPELTVERITGAHAMISDGNARTPVALQARTGPSITMAGGGAVVDRVEVPQPQEEQPSAIAGQRELPAGERNRRARALERQRNGTLNTGPEGALRPPENMATFGVNERRARDAAREQSGD
jgi:hypothetical protein